MNWADVLITLTLVGAITFLGFWIILEIIDWLRK